MARSREAVHKCRVLFLSLSRRLQARKKMGKRHTNTLCALRHRDAVTLFTFLFHSIVNWLYAHVFVAAYETACVECLIERCRAFEHHQKHSIIRLMCSDQKRVLIALDWSVLSVCRAFEKTLSWPSQWFWEEARLIAQLWHWKLFCEMKNDSGKEEAKVLIYRFSEGILEVSLCCFCHETEKYCLHTFTLRWMQLMSFIWCLE